MIAFIDEASAALLVDMIKTSQRLANKLDNFNGPGIHNDPHSMSFTPLDVPQSSSFPDAVTLPVGQYQGMVWCVVTQNTMGFSFAFAHQML